MHKADFYRIWSYAPRIRSVAAGSPETQLLVIYYLYFYFMPRRCQCSTRL
jgi:hypothetical protein